MGGDRRGVKSGLNEEINPEQCKRLSEKDVKISNPSVRNSEQCVGISDVYENI